MSSRIKTILAGLSLFLFLAGALPSGILANPYEQLTSDQSLYQRVKKLGDYGLLDPQDKALLDEGKVVTRMELAFYTEKAKARISPPSLPLPPSAQPTPVPPQPVLIPDLMTLPPSLIASPTPVPAVTAPPVVPPAAVPPAVRSEIDELLKELRAESSYLKTRMAMDDSRVKEHEDEVAKLKATQETVDTIWRKANKSGGIPHFNSKSATRIENFHLSGIATENVTRAVNEIKVEMYTDLAGKGAIDLGFVGQVSSSNASSGAVSLAPYSPWVTFLLDGPLGRWDTNFIVEGYKGDTTLGNFSRGISPTSIRRFEHPFEIKSFSEDKNTKIWDDYMNSVGFVATSTIGAQSTNDRVFDGLYMTGVNLPFTPRDGKVNFLVGRMGTTTSQTQRWEQGLKYSQPWANGLFRSELTAYWVNDNFGNNQTPQIDLKNYAANFTVNADPFLFNIDAGMSHFFTGADNRTSTPSPIEAGAGQASLAFYPFTFYYSAIAETYANFQSKVTMASFDFQRYGVAFTADKVSDVYGAIGEVDNLISDRYGWRANLGWNGRKQKFMKDWPSFLDAIVVNFDVSQKTEYKTMYSPEGYNVIEPVNMVTFYYPDDEGVWGLNLWGGYANPPYTVRNTYISNIQALRKDGNSSYDDARYLFQMSSERIPLMVPVLDVNGQPATYTVITVKPAPDGSGPITYQAGQIIYTNLTHLKSYNYITLTTKLQFNKMFGLETPFYGSVFFTDNRISGKATDSTQSDIANMFEQTVYDGALMLQAFKNVNLSVDYGLETWKSAYTYPQIDYRTDSLGAGFAWDIPWGGGKLECRYKHLIFRDAFVPLNNYDGDQYFANLMFVF